MTKSVLYAILVCFWQVAPALAGGSPVDAGLQIYSDMGFIREEGEYSGLQIVIVPYNPDYGARKEKALWRSGNGNLDTPLLLDVTRVGDKLALTVPEENPAHGKWLLTVHGDSLLAKGLAVCIMN